MSLNKTIDERILRQLARHRQGYRGVGGVVNSAAAVSLVSGEGLQSEPIQAAELMQHYGITSNPPPGFMFVAVPIGGKTAHSIIVATEHGNYRLKGLKSGEMAIYDDQGKKVYLTRDGIVVDGGGKTITIQNTPKLLVDAPVLECTGEIVDKSGSNAVSMSSMRATYNSHTHPGDSGGTTGGPNQGMV